MKNDELKELLAIINPQKEEGRVVIITRYGAGKVDELLSGHIKVGRAWGGLCTAGCKIAVGIRQHKVERLPGARSRRPSGDR